MNDVKIFYYEQLDNTINQSKKLIKNNAQTPFAVICDEQLNGVASRPNKSWDSPSAGNIYLTFVYKLPEECDDLVGLSNRILNAISKHLNFKIDSNLIYIDGNDIMHNKLKMGGQMLEVDLNSRNAIFSIGLNINSTKKDFDVDLQNKITTLREVSNQYHDIAEITKEIIKIIIDS